MLDYMEAACNKRGCRLHYVTAREAYNLVQAAEDNVQGDPEEYRSYALPPPCNVAFNTTVPVKILAMSAGRISFESDASLEGEFRFNHPDLLYIKGALGRLEYSAADTLLRAEAQGAIEVTATRQVRIEGVSCRLTLEKKTPLSEQGRGP